MKKVIFLFLITFVILFFSCKKNLVEQSINKDDVYSVMTASLEDSEDLEEGDMQIEVINDFVKTKYNNLTGNFHIVGNVEGIGQSIDGQLTVGNYSVPNSDDDRHFYGSTENFQDFNENFLGQHIDFVLTNNSVFSDFQVNHYIPHKINVSLNDYSRINRNDGLVINYDNDNQNGSNPFIVVIQYNPFNNENEPLSEAYPEMITKSFEIEENEGESFLSSNDLNDFPADCKLDIYVGRGNEEDYDINGKKLRIVALSVTTIRNVLLVD